MSEGVKGPARRLGGLGSPTVEPVADGVWLVRGMGTPPHRSMNVYLIEDEGGVTVFDAGVERMAKWIALAASPHGGVKRVVLGHAHQDHRGAAPGLGAPVWCHEADRADAEGDAGEHYFRYSELPGFTKAGPIRFAFPRLLRMWDGGPVKIERTLTENDEVAGFRVVHLPGHAPGLIGLFRESDRLALVSDCFYTLDPTTGDWGDPRVPHPAFTPDVEEARASMRKLAEIEPAEAWPGHANPILGDVRAILERAAAST